MKFRVRQMCDLDMDEVLELSVASMPVGYELSIDDILHANHLNNVRILIAEHGGKLVGFAVMVKCDRKYVLEQLCVDEAWRNQGVGSLLVATIVNRLSKKKTHISCTVPEKMLGAQKFFRSIGFSAVRVLKDYKESEDAYLFVGSAMSFFDRWRNTDDDGQHIESDIAKMQGVRESS